MSEFDKIDTPEGDRQIVEIPVPAKNVHIGSNILRRGQKLWEINPETEEITLALFKSVEVQKGVEIKGGHPLVGGLKADIVRSIPYYKSDHYYVAAINKSNALRHYYRMRGWSTAGL